MFAAGILAKTGVDFKRQFNLASYKRFFSDLGFENVQYRIIAGHMPCAFAIIKNI